MDLGLKDKVVVVLSSAAGIGKGIATEAAREGAKVAIATAEAFRADLEKAQADIEAETGNKPYCFYYDVLDDASITKMIECCGSARRHLCAGQPLSRTEGRFLRSADGSGLGGRLSEVPAQLHYVHPGGTALHEKSRRRPHPQQYILFH